MRRPAARPASRRLREREHAPLFRWLVGFQIPIRNLRVGFLISIHADVLKCLQNNALNGVVSILLDCA